MVKVDPAALEAAAARIAAKSRTVAGGQPLHPPLASDQASVAAAGRLSTAGTEVLNLLVSQVAALNSAAAQLGLSGLIFAEQEHLNASATSTVSPGAGPVSAPGVARKAPQVPADVRPEFGATTPIPGDAISTLVHSGLGNDAGFATSMDDVAMFSTDTSSVVQSVVDELPDIWEGPNSMPVAQHLMDHANGLQQTSEWARKLAEQSRAYSNQYGQAATDIPTPQDFASVDAQLQQAVTMNTASGGMFTALVNALMSRRQELETRAQQGYSTYQVSTEATTASTTDPASIVSAMAPMALSLASGAASGLGVLTGAAVSLLDGMIPSTPPAVTDLAQSDDNDTEGSQTEENSSDDGETATADSETDAPDSDPLLTAGQDPLLAGPMDPLATDSSTNQMASMLPMMIPTVLGAASGALGTVGKIPEALTQAATQAVSAATQGLSSALTPPTDITTDTTDLTDIGDTPLGMDNYSSSPGSPGPGDTTPAAGTPLSAVAPSTGTTPTLAPIPAGSAGPVAATPAHSGYMGGMGGMPFMPMGSRMNGAQGTDDKREQTDRKLLPPTLPHGEQVTGKVTADRVAIANAAENSPPPNPNADTTAAAGGADAARPTARRITTRPRDES